MVVGAIVVGIDVVVLAMVAGVLVIATYVSAAIVNLTEDEGRLVVAAVAVTGTTMVIAYVIMARILDAMM